MSWVKKCKYCNSKMRPTLIRHHVKSFHPEEEEKLEDNLLAFDKEHGLHEPYREDVTSLAVERLQKKQEERI